MADSRIMRRRGREAARSRHWEAEESSYAIQAEDAETVAARVAAAAADRPCAGGLRADGHQSGNPHTEYPGPAGAGRAQGIEPVLVHPDRFDCGLRDCGFRA